MSSRPDTVTPLKSPGFGRRYNWHLGRNERICVFEDLSMNLPLEASLAGMTLTFEAPIDKDDPIYLKDKAGNILFEWDKPPSLSEVREVTQFLK